jgi:2-polyprenyl-3-methyl-5-hydroxy-6-metoxy-1,4-benzoquinol methylase
MANYNKMLDSRIKENEKSVLETFQAEIPSVYFSDKSEKDFIEYKANAEYMYRDLFKFPPEMFKGKKLIDFGAGTGENTVSLASWGATCTLVEMNNLAQDISKDVFQKYTNNFDDHNFILSSIFDFDQPDKYESFDIVHCRGVLSHTADKKGAFDIIAKYLKPGGYLIFGDPNKVGGFQNMLQRFTVYNFASTWGEMISVSETLFKDDIDRSVKYNKRTRNTIIFDRWVVQKQDDPSIKEVLEWFENNKLSFYSAYPSFLLPFFSDSVHHSPKFDINQFKDIGVITEAIWMFYGKDDSSEVPKMLSSLNDFSLEQESLTNYLSKSDSNMEIDYELLTKKIDKYVSSADSLDLTKYLSRRINQLLAEVKGLVKIIEEKDLNKVKNFIDTSKYLFKDALGVRHNDFIAYKPK